MRVREQTPMKKLLAHHPDATQSVLSWYGVRTGPDTLGLTLEEVCARHGVDLDDVLVDLQSQFDDEDEDEDDD